MKRTTRSPAFRNRRNVFHVCLPAAQANGGPAVKPDPHAPGGKLDPGDYLAVMSKYRMPPFQPVSAFTTLLLQTIGFA